MSLERRYDKTNTCIQMCIALIVVVGTSTKPLELKSYSSGHNLVELRRRWLTELNQLTNVLTYSWEDNETKSILLIRNVNADLIGRVAFS